LHAKGCFPMSGNGVQGPYGSSAPGKLSASEISPVSSRSFRFLRLTTWPRFICVPTSTLPAAVHGLPVGFARRVQAIHHGRDHRDCLVGRKAAPSIFASSAMAIIILVWFMAATVLWTLDTRKALVSSERTGERQNHAASIGSQLAQATLPHATPEQGHARSDRHQGRPSHCTRAAERLIRLRQSENLKRSCPL
jgi:hypothetical protein